METPDADWAGIIHQWLVQAVETLQTALYTICQWLLHITQIVLTPFAYVAAYIGKGLAFCGRILFENLWEILQIIVLCFGIVAVVVVALYAALLLIAVVLDVLCWMVPARTHGADVERTGLLSGSQRPTTYTSSHPESGSSRSPLTGPAAVSI